MHSRFHLAWKCVGDNTECVTTTYEDYCLHTSQCAICTCNGDLWRRVLQFAEEGTAELAAATSEIQYVPGLWLCSDQLLMSGLKQLTVKRHISHDGILPEPQVQIIRGLLI